MAQCLIFFQNFNAQLKIIEIFHTPVSLVVEAIVPKGTTFNDHRGGGGYSDRWDYSDNLCFRFRNRRD